MPYGNLVTLARYRRGPRDYAAVITASREKKVSVRNITKVNLLRVRRIRTATLFVPRLCDGRFLAISKPLSLLSRRFILRPGDGTGRHTGLKILGPQGRASSSLALGTYHWISFFFLQHHFPLSPRARLEPANRASLGPSHGSVSPWARTTGFPFFSCSITFRCLPGRDLNQTVGRATFSGILPPPVSESC